MPDDRGATETTTAFSDVASFVRGIAFADLPPDVALQATRCLLDLIGVAAAGTRTRASEIARSYAASQLCGRDETARILFDGRRAGIAGAAFAGATTIDAVDGHDGHVLAKGHAGVTILPALLALCDGADREHGFDGREFLACLTLGYEIATRAGIAQHASVPEYHCSGSWNSIGCAAIAARFLSLDEARTREALGIAEYFGPRGQMLRTCESPSMVKDGSGSGAYAGITAAWLAREGYTGAPAATVESADARQYWTDLGARWRIREQYFKAYPVCRWAQPAVEAALALQRAHRFAAEDIVHISIESFREAIALGSRRSAPETTEDAQYSLSYPVAAVLVFGVLGAEEIAVPKLAEPRVRRLLGLMVLTENADFSRLFPAERWARVEIVLNDGRKLVSEPACARGNPENALTDAELRVKYFELAEPVLGQPRAQRIERLVSELRHGDALNELLEELLQPA
ncbi:MAG TPA: MmgE/PrpD family protein [Casimicrobiaceae bacterium]|jgi:2-methylcitrate dehydratase PrpD|nr:MmgE/PrpD family protein [Casimicrobiaceae bacterium]